MKRLIVCIIAFSAGCSSAFSNPGFVFVSWQPDVVGNCLITAQHTTSDCQLAQTPEGITLPDSWRDQYMNGRSLPDAPVGTRVWAMFRPLEPVEGVPPETAQATTTALHMKELEGQLYPKTAREQKLEGRASADCTVLSSGALDNCWISAETPANSGFGEATLNLMRLVKLSSPLPASGTQTFDISWQIPQAPDQIFVTCSISPDYSTKDCKADSDAYFPESADSELKRLQTHPLHLANAPVGKRIEISLLRSEPSQKQTIGQADAPPSSYIPLKLTRLRGDDLAYYYPALSVRLAETGATTVQCKVTDDGRLNECWIPYNQINSDRLAHAHLRLTELVQMATPAANSPKYDNRLYQFKVVWMMR